MADLDTLIADNMGLVYKQLHKFNRAYDDEAFSHAVEALMRAAETYDSTKGATFSNYASVCIYNSIAHYLRELQRANKLSVVYYDDTINAESNITFADILHDKNTPETEALKKEFYKVLWQKFDNVLLETTNETSKRAILMWRDSDFTAKQEEIAVVMNTTQSTVSRALSAFKYKLKKEMEDYLCEK